MFSFVAEHANGDEVVWSVLQFRPYVMMMNTRAKANLALEKGDVEAAMLLVEKGISRIERFIADSGRREEDGDSVEAESLREWLGELKKIKPLTAVEKLEHEMAQAVQAEEFERAAELRDAIRSLQQKG
jgi:hypothetical protein